MNQEYVQEIGVLAVFILLIAGSLGCATMTTLSAIEDRPPAVALTDDIIAIGRPDAALRAQIGQTDVVAFLGLKQTYLLFKGGRELERIAQSPLDDERIQIQATNRNLYLQEQKVWGQVGLIYQASEPLSAEEQQILQALNFSQSHNRFYRSVSVAGLVYPPIQLASTQNLLKRRRPIQLYSTQKAAPSIEHYAATALLPLAMVTDVILTPLYLGFGIVVITANALD
ncbi:MAG: hypothetical protein SVR94_11635 [Pseudomonadota bacterium]|nr:hypothetical protein [Pseudomonadota bacterium]